MKPLRICVLCLLVFFAGRVAAFAASIPFTGQFEWNPTFGDSAFLTGPSFSLQSETFDGSGFVGGCTPGNTCVDVATEIFWIQMEGPADNVVGTLDGVSGYVEGDVNFQYTLTAPALDSGAWTDMGDYSLATFDPNVPATFSGVATAISCTAVGGPTPCWSGDIDYPQFTVDLNGIADLDYILMAGNSYVDNIIFT